jgi:hypothetical protein
LRKLDDYKIIYLPLATYADRSLADGLTAWVEAGGTLVCGDPLAFSWAPDGSDLSDTRESLFGVKTGEAVEQHEIVVGQTRVTLFPRRTPTNPAFTARAIEVASGVEVLGQYANREPAIVRCKLGSGVTIYFAANPFTPASLLGDAPWAEVLRAFQKAVDEPTDQPIWRFRLPQIAGEAIH